MKITEYKPNGHTTAKDATSLAASIKTAQAAGRIPERLGKNLATAVENTWREMQAMTDHAQDEGRDFLASESRTYTDMEAALDLLAPLNKELSRIDFPDGLQAAQDAAWGRGSDAPEYAEGRPLAKGQTFASYIRNRGIRAAGEDVSDGVDLDKYLRGVLFNQWRGADRELKIANAMSGASSTAGGVLIPTVLLGQIIDLARAQTHVLEAGAQVVPMESRTVDVPRWTTDPTFSWRTENAIVAESDGALDKVTLSAKDLGTVVRVSRDLVEDTNIAGALSGAFASAFALKIDNAALYGAGSGGAPTGVKVDSNVTKTALGSGNGATPTDWGFLVDSVGRVRDANEYPTAAIMADRTARVLAKLKDTTNQPLRAPEYLDGLERRTTSGVPVNLTVGTSNDTSDCFVADWSKLIIGVRTELVIEVLRERYMTNDAAGSPAGGQYGFLAWWRGDIVLAQPKAFDVTTGIRG